MESELRRRIHRYRLSRPWDDEVAAILEDLADRVEELYELYDRVSDDGAL